MFTYLNVKFKYQAIEFLELISLLKMEIWLLLIFIDSIPGADPGRSKGAF